VGEGIDLPGHFYSKPPHMPQWGPLAGHVRFKAPQGMPRADAPAVMTRQSTGEPPGDGASGSVNRSSCPESVRYMSVTIVVQRRLLTDDDRG
jgi:hypothetical protein